MYWQNVSGIRDFMSVQTVSLIWDWMSGNGGFDINTKCFRNGGFDVKLVHG